MTALLGLLAIAGYQNRDKLAELVRGWQSNPGAPQSGGAGGATTGNLGGLLGGTSLGDLLSGGLRDLVDRFNQKGQGEVADSWVNRGPNKQIFFPGFPRICQRLSTSIRPKAGFPPQRSFRDPRASWRRPATF